MTKQPNFNQERALEEIKKMENVVEKLRADLQALKSNLENKATPQKEQLDIIVTDLEQLDRLMSDRTDVGH